MRSIIALLYLAFAATVSAQAQTPVAVPAACGDCNSVLSEILKCPAVVSTPTDKASWDAAAATLVPCVCKAVTSPGAATCYDCLQSADGFSHSTQDFSALRDECGKTTDAATAAFYKVLRVNLNAAPNATASPTATSTPESQTAGAGSIAANSAILAIAGVFGLASVL
ncbi:hypothetical protein HK097_011407 [Rhizophlyctis rosea]|uniref:Uncharacterized protein n=1 Tax=Rhizophlyctis rosea TaxID=64517 RepID=A0AAD5X1X0_9FUNG|nr:hypothetical protein HK097_011407 [Rhizophlyctis rosea]